MKTLATLLGTVALTLTALAGPEPVPSGKEMKEVAPPPPPECNWTGFYIGVNGGYAFNMDVEVTDLDFLNIGPPARSFSYDAEGPVGGAQIGYNWQARPWLVLGVEGDGGYLGVFGRDRQPESPDPGTFAKTNPGAYATARGRIGYAHDCWLFYATGGWFGSDYERRIDDRFRCACGFKLGSAEDEDWRSGWTAGGGVEWMFKHHWTVRVEYLYFDASNGNVTVPIVQTGPFRFRFDEDNGMIVRAGLNYKF